MNKLCFEKKFSFRFYFAFTFCENFNFNCISISIIEMILCLFISIWISLSKSETSLSFCKIVVLALENACVKWCVLWLEAIWRFWYTARRVRKFGHPWHRPSGGRDLIFLFETFIVSLNLTRLLSKKFHKFFSHLKYDHIFKN